VLRELKVWADEVDPDTTELTGEVGVSRACVEVLVPDGDCHGAALVVLCDPTHGPRGGWRYVTLATGRDYADVAPTSGSYRDPCKATLSYRRRMRAAGPARPSDALAGPDGRL
jgi:hypothetical protein